MHKLLNLISSPNTKTNRYISHLLSSPKKSKASMDSSTKLAVILLLASSLLLQGTLGRVWTGDLLIQKRGEVICEDLPTDICSFSIASSGKRCLLENYAAKDGKVGYQCRTSEVVVERMAEYIETDECVSACGVDRNSVGISSDSLLEPQSTAKLCSPSCYQNCPNIVDLYFNLAAGEGVFLPDLCQKQRTNPRRAMIELLSSGVAPGPVSIESDHLAHVPAPSPAFF